MYVDTCIVIWVVIQLCDSASDILLIQLASKFKILLPKQFAAVARRPNILYIKLENKFKIIF